MSIDKEKILDFWVARALKDSNEDVKNSANLEDDPALSKLKVQLENKKVEQYLMKTNLKGHALDLGSGFGYWSREISRYYDSVIGVDFCKEMTDRATEELKKNFSKNVKFVCSEAQNFIEPKKKFNFIFISGLLIYLNDKDLNKLITNINSYTKEGAHIILRDGTGVDKKFEIKDKFSENLQAHYSALYRSRDSYIELFKQGGFQLCEDEDMFDKGHILNKFKETRLRIYLFKKDD